MDCIITLDPRSYCSMLRADTRMAPRSLAKIVALTGNLECIFDRFVADSADIPKNYSQHGRPWPRKPSVFAAINRKITAGSWLFLAVFLPSCSVD